MVAPDSMTMTELRIWEASIQASQHDLDLLRLALIEQGHAQYHDFLHRALRDERRSCRKLIDQRLDLAA